MVASTPALTTTTTTTTAWCDSTPSVDASRATERTAQVGGGTATQTGQIPQTGSAGGGALMGAMMDSLRKMMPDVSGEKLQVILLEVMTKMKDAMNETEKEKIKVDQEAKRQALQDKQSKINDAEAKQAEAAEKREKLSVWDKVKIAFEYIAAITSFIAGALALATSWLTGPAGIAAGVMLISAGVLLLTMAIDSTYVAANGKGSLGLVGEAHKAVLMGKGVSEEEATEQACEADKIAKIVFTAVSAALMLGAAVAGGVSAFQLGFAVMKAVQGTAGIVTNTVSAAATIAKGTGDITAAVGQRQATDLEADARRLTGESKEFQALVSVLEDMIDLVMTRMKGINETFEANLDALVSAAKDTGETYGRVGMRA